MREEKKKLVSDEISETSSHKGDAQNEKKADPNKKKKTIIIAVGIAIVIAVLVVVLVLVLKKSDDDTPTDNSKVNPYKVNSVSSAPGGV